MTYRMTTRNTIPKVSLYESDQEDNLNDADYFPEKYESDNESLDESYFTDEDYFSNRLTRNRSTATTKKMDNPVSKDNMKKRKQKLEKVETKEKKLLDRKKRDKRLTIIKAEASRSKNIQQISSLTEIERTQTKRELKKYLLEAKVLQEKIAELDEMLFLDSGAQYVRWSK